jgi:hypothetical protein
MDPNLLLKRGLVMAPEGGASAAGGANAGAADDKADAAKMSQAQLDEINRIFDAREKRTLGKIDEMFKSRDAERAKAKEARRAEKDKAKAEKAAAKGAAGPADGKGDPASEARFKALEKQLAEERKLREEERSKRLADEERSSVTEALTASGIVNVKGALALLREDGRIGRSKDGQVIFKQPKEGYVEELAVLDGIKAWADTDEGKFYLPPKGAAGSGAGGGAAPGRRSGAAPTKEERQRDALATLNQLPLQRPTY